MRYGLIALVVAASAVAAPGDRAAAPATAPPVTRVQTIALGSALAPTGAGHAVRGHPAGIPLSPDVVLRRAPVALRAQQPRTTAFSAVGVTWAAGPTDGVSVAVRTSSAGRWNAWSTTSAEESPVEPRRRDGAELVWTGPADGIEVVVTSQAGAAPSDVRVELIDPGQGAGHESSPRRLANGPPIRTRAQWGADERKMTWRPEYARALKAVVLHHTATTNTYTPADVPGIMRSIYHFHAVSRGWGDIGYNVLVDRFGQAWEGRAGGLDRIVVGAHAGGFNTGTAGISMIGDFTGTQPPPAALETVARLLAWKYAAHGIDPQGSTVLTGGPNTRYKTRVTITVPVLFPHKLTSVTACPGRYGEAALAGLRDRAAALIADPSAPVPQPTSTPTPIPTPTPSAVPTPTPVPTADPEPSSTPTAG